LDLTATRRRGEAKPVASDTGSPKRLHIIILPTVRHRSRRCRL